MPKQFRTKLAGAIVTLSMVAAPVAAFANDLVITTEPGPAHDSYYPADDLNGGQGGEIGTFDKTEETEVPQVSQEELEKPVSEGLGPLGGVMPTVDENGNNTNKVPNITEQETNNKKPSNKKPSTTTTTSKKTTSKKTSSSSTTISNPKTGDVSVLSYAGLGLASVAGLLRKRK